MRRLLLVSSLVAALLVAVDLHSDDNCTDVLRSVYDITNRTERFSYSHSFYGFLCESTFSSYSAARDKGASLGVSLESLPINLGGHDRETSWTQYQHNLCTAIKQQTGINRELAQAVQTINSQVIDAWKTCVSSRAGGLYFHAETDDKAGENGTVTFRARWIDATGGAPSIAVTPTLKVTPPTALQCHDQQFPSLLDVATQSITCERVSDQAVRVAFTTQMKGTKDVRVPEKLKPRREAPAKMTAFCLPAGGFHALQVEANQPIRIRAAIKGSCSKQGWSCNRGSTHCGPDGEAGQTKGGAVDPGSNIGALLAYFTTRGATTVDDIASMAKPAGPIRVGGAFDGVAPLTGFMYLFFNDYPGGYDDNLGAIWIEISTQDL